MRTPIPMLAVLAAALALAAPAAAQWDDGPPAYRAGQRLAIEAAVALPGAAPPAGVKLMELRCTACGTPEPAMVLQLDANGYATVDRGGIGYGVTGPTAAVAFPRDRWVHVIWAIELSAAPARVMVLFDGAVALDATVPTLPDWFAVLGAGILLSDVAYDAVAAGLPAATGPQALAGPVTVTAPP